MTKVSLSRAECRVCKEWSLVAHRSKDSWWGRQMFPRILISLQYFLFLLERRYCKNFLWIINILKSYARSTWNGFAQFYKIIKEKKMDHFFPFVCYFSGPHCAEFILLLFPHPTPSDNFKAKGALNLLLKICFKYFNVSLSFCVNFMVLGLDLHFLKWGYCQHCKNWQNCCGKIYI